jgi:vancomycin resistance protein YoaR
VASSKNFLTFVGWLSIASIVILSGFYLGFAFFITDMADELDIVKVKNLAEEFNESPNVSLDIYIQNDKKVIPSETIEEWFETYTREYTNKKDVRVSHKEVEEYLTSIAPLVNSQPVNAKFILVDGKAQEFIPSEYGRNLNIDASKKLITAAIINGAKEVILPVELTEPDITLDRINKLGITTLIGHGESDFKGSPSSRVHNIKVGSAKYNGTVVKPGEEFSFNDILGEVDDKNGYQPELVIKGGKLIYEYGGGLCQVSTTLFRSAIMAGLPILERKPHSFPVKYYDPQGYDATIYPGVVDLKFRNDTLNHILIQSRIENTKLIFDIYGSGDGREVFLDGPYQYDQRKNGSMKAYFVRKITYADGSTKEKRFDSNYGASAPLERNPLE